MRAINHYIIAKNIKTEPKKVAGLIMTDDTDVDNRYIKAEIISIGNLVEGIKEKDIFILEAPETQKFYFKVTDLGKAETFLELISQAGNIEVKDGHTVRIVEGL